MGRPNNRTLKNRKYRTKESEVEREARLEKDRKRLREKILNESDEQRIERRLRNSIRSKHRRKKESSTERNARISKIRMSLENESEEHRTHRNNVQRKKLDSETEEQRKHRKDVQRKRLSNETDEQRTHRKNVQRKRLNNETEEERNRRIELVKKRQREESEDQREKRLATYRQRATQRIDSESLSERDSRLNNARMVTIRNRRMSFDAAINTFADVPCQICNKQLYPKQCHNLKRSERITILPEELSSLDIIVSCQRCINTVKKNRAPAQAFWNHMEVVEIPQELDELSEVEKRFLCRIVPFLKIIRVQNRFSQHWCKGQVVLFAQDVLEIAEQLPLRADQAGIIIIKHINWLVIDEISMVSYEILRMIHLRLQEYKSNKQLFGGINILLFGDIMQLPPVKGHWCFKQPTWFAAEINLWHKFSFCELTINMRQRGDTEFIGMLNKLRFGELTVAELEVLCERRQVPLEGEFADGAAIRIYPTVRQVDEYNELMATNNAKLHQTYIINAVDESREPATYGKTPPDNVIPKDVNNFGGLLTSIVLAEESRVMLRRNISVTDGLVNGAMGIIKKFKWPAMRRDQLEDGELPELVYIKFDDSTIGLRIQTEDGLIGIPPETQLFKQRKDSEMLKGG